MSMTCSSVPPTSSVPRVSRTSSARGGGAATSAGAGPRRSCSRRPSSSAVSHSGAVLLTRSGGGGPSVDVADSAGAQWTTVRNDQFGLSMTVPPGWPSTSASLTPNLTDPREVLSAGTFEVAPQGSCILPPTVQSMAPTDVFVTVYLWQYWPAGSRRGRTTSAPSSGTARSCASPCPTASRAMINFSDHGRELSALVVLGNQATPQQQADAFKVLDSLVVSPAAAPDTTTTAPVSSPLTGPVVTTPVPAVETTPPTTYAKGSVEDKVRTAFLGWTDSKPLDAKRPYIEDFDQIKATMEQAKAQAPPGLDVLHGVIESVTIVDATHAHVVYGFLNGDQSVVSGLPGDVVKIGGRWLVTRETVCASFALEGVTCPPRTG